MQAGCGPRELVRENRLLNSAAQYLYQKRIRHTAPVGEPLFYGSPEDETNSYRVAFLCDEMTWADFSPLCRAQFLHPAVWREQLERFRPDFFFCESCWSGVPPFEGCWRGQVYRNRRLLFENRRVLLEILAYCRQQGIPTVFWNKEDPAGSLDARYDFIDTALRFDYIFTTAEECIETYRRRGHQQVALLPFGVNPALFYPDVSLQRPGTALFAGSWYADQPERCKALTELLEYALAQGWQLDIYDRHSGSKERRFRFPERFAPYLRPAVPFARMPELARRYEWAINVNTVTTSQTMFSRRVLQMLASGTKVLSNPSPAMERFPGVRPLLSGQGYAILRVEGEPTQIVAHCSNMVRFRMVTGELPGVKRQCVTA